MGDSKAMILTGSHDLAHQVKRLCEPLEVTLAEWRTSGTEWMSTFQSLKPAVFFVDFILPKRDGLFCIHKALEFNRGLKAVLFHSYVGDAANEVELKAFAVGVGAVVQKPVVEPRFEAMLRRLLALHDTESTQLKRSLVLK